MCLGWAAAQLVESVAPSSAGNANQADGPSGLGWFQLGVYMLCDLNMGCLQQWDPTIES